MKKNQQQLYTLLENGTWYQKSHRKTSTHMQQKSHHECIEEAAIIKASKAGKMLLNDINATYPNPFIRFYYDYQPQTDHQHHFPSWTIYNVYLPTLVSFSQCQMMTVHSESKPVALIIQKLLWILHTFLIVISVFSKVIIACLKLFIVVCKPPPSGNQNFQNFYGFVLCFRPYCYRDKLCNTTLNLNFACFDVPFRDLSPPPRGDLYC